MTDIKPTKEEIDLIKYSVDLLIHEQLSEEHALLDLIYERQQNKKNITITVEPNTELLIGPNDDVSKYGHHIIVKNNKETKYLINTHKIIYIK